MPSQVPGGFVGVDIFFVISGFLITSILRKQISDRTFSFSDFLARRARRIVPALACVALVSFVAAYLILSPEQLSEFGRTLATTALFGANFHFYRTTDYFASPAQEQPLLHAWSLSIEEQFYLVWPLVLLLLLTRVPRRTALLIVVGAIMASFVAFQIYAQTEPTYAFYMPHTRAWELLLGALLALGVEDLDLSPRTSEVVAALGLGGIAASSLLFSETAPYPGFATSLATLGTAAIIIACSRQQPVVGRMLGFAPVVWVGLISYSLYLWHWPIFSFAKLQAPPEPSWTMVPLLVLASFVLAWLSWRYIETPFRGQFGRLRFPARKALASAMAALVLVAGVGVAVRAGDGWAWRLDDISRTVYDQIASSNPRRRSCDGVEGIFSKDQFCGFGREREAGQSYDVAIFGDSNADHFVPMLSVLAERRGLAGRQVHPEHLCASARRVAAKTAALARGEVPRISGGDHSVHRGEPRSETCRSLRELGKLPEKSRA